MRRALLLDAACSYGTTGAGYTPRNFRHEVGMLYSQKFDMRIGRPFNPSGGLDLHDIARITFPILDGADPGATVDTLEVGTGTCVYVKLGGSTTHTYALLDTNIPRGSVDAVPPAALSRKLLPCRLELKRLDGCNNRRGSRGGLRAFVHALLEGCFPVLDPLTLADRHGTLDVPLPVLSVHWQPPRFGR